MGIYIPTAKRSRLLKYKYSSTDKSLTSKYILNPYWNWLVTLFPKTIAPNTITLLGLLCVFVNFATLLYYNPTLSCEPKPLHVSKGGSWDPLFKPLAGSGHGGFGGWISWFGLGAAKDAASQCAPRWLYFTFAAGLFIYQSLDAIDGKQARRTGTSGPLGELFDHGCDALNTTLEVILTASAMNLGLSWWTGSYIFINTIATMLRPANVVASLVATNANFYLTTWEEFHTGTLYLSAFSGPVEGILMIVVVFIVTGIYGPGFWDRGVLTVTGLNSLPFVADLPIKDLPLNDLFLSFSTFALLFNIVSSTKNVLKALTPQQRASPMSLARPLARLSPWVLHTSAMLLWLYSTPELLNTTLLLPFMSFWGISFAHHVGLLILSHLTASKFPGAYKHPLLVMSALGAVDSTGWLWKPTAERFGRHGLKVEVLTCLAASVLVYGHFVYEVVGDICAFYDINCLTIKKHSRGPPEEAKKAIEAEQAANFEESVMGSAEDKKRKLWNLKKKN